MKIGFIGVGNMAQAIIHGMPNKQDVIISARTYEDTLFKASKLGVKAASSHQMCVLESDIVILAVKPQQFSEVLDGIKDVLIDKTLVSIAAKVTFDDLERMCGRHAMIRVMPNLNVAIGQGMSAIADNGIVSQVVYQKMYQILEHLGHVVALPESQISGFIGVAGSSPAFVFKFVDAMAQEAQKEGIPYETALEMATYAVAGSANYLRISGVDAQILVDRVCSPGGTTIEGVSALDAEDFVGTVQKAVRASINKDKLK